MESGYLDVLLERILLLFREKWSNTERIEGLYLWDDYTIKKPLVIIISD